MARKTTPTEEPTPTEETAVKERRARVTSDDAVFLEEFTVDRPPAGLRDYTPTPYDGAMDDLWERYVEAGEPAWSRSVTAEKPEGGYWADRDDIYLSTVVPNLDHARALITRAARRNGCSSRIRSEELGDGTFRIWFTAAPVLPKGATAGEAGAEETTGE